jgi:hypothetical protein
MKKLLSTSLLISIGALFGYFMVLLLPVIFVTWLQSYAIQSPIEKPHKCAAGDIEKEETLAGWMHKQDDGSFTWTWYP